ncbi:peptidoglycan DD-metalloendopeptidase family protein [Sphingomonas sp. AOB5]|uniref:peptidoglycan DD-metalloendopeptidase family protein n=1 Tax=Sphingomonas sp. AOB5 TaxID=3034017 RepID=UPI0023F87E2C|nr:peptidoglycan DD-metalloendopeptidase family protein [Sphingomonas sp. AOB5]MDF7774113.1 peptidoglycan DD-metalloendopeptidase family protein [Sphingomonas sp. AOB5]
MWKQGLALVAFALVAACGPLVPPAPGYGEAAPPRRQQQYDPPPRQDAPRVDPDVESLPAPPPAWQMRPVTADARDVVASTYTVRSGDSLRLIAVKTGAGSEAIARANNLAPPYTIQPGQRLTIPAGRYHTVRDGETGIAIAQAYGVSWSRIVTVNDLQEPYILRTGMRILIPATGPETLEERASRFRINIDDIVTGGQPALADKAKPARPTASSARVLPSTTPVTAPERLTTAFQWPVNGGSIVKRFGPGQSGERNDGIKIAVPLDTPIVAAADGVVAYVGSDIPALGGLVILRHGDAWTTVYGHAGQLLVQRGQSVKKGQMIALSGNSGHADRPELHFEIRQGRTPVDPVPRLPTRR